MSCKGNSGKRLFQVQTTKDDVPTFWVPGDSAVEVLRYLKTEAEQPYQTLYDLTVIDERVPHTQG